MHDIFEIGLPPHARIIPITKPDDRVGTLYIPCPPEKIAAIVLTDHADEPQKFKPYSEATRIIGENVVKFLRQEIAPAVCRRIRARSSRVSLRRQRGAQQPRYKRLPRPEHVHRGHAGFGAEPDRAGCV